MNNRKILYFSCITLIFSPLVLVYFLYNKTLLYVSIYGLYIIVYSIVQVVYSLLNRNRINKLSKMPSSLMYNILVVGYKEDPIIYTECLKSCKKLLDNPKVCKIIVVIDGNNHEDQYMVDIYNEVFGDSMKGVCISQKHAGKRHVLYTGLKMSCDMNVYGVLCTDSDTVLDINALDRLANVLESSPTVGAVSGNVKIRISGKSLIMYLSSIRYWFSCNIERAYQSYNDCVLCVSGPLGVYRVSLLSHFLDKWLTQEFLGRPCTYGDDRHLTNNILMMGYKVLYTHLAFCYTDTPETITKFFNQQVRWCKSSYRELLWTYKCIELHSLWLSIDLIYQTIYSFIVVGSLIYILFYGTFFELNLYIFTIIVINLIKGLYGVWLEKDLQYLLYSLYGLVYISILVPAKLYSGVTLGNIDWGGSSLVPIILLNVWCILLSSGLIYNIIGSAEIQDYVTMAILVSYIIINICIAKFMLLKK